jgi:AbrB family looped-hinge helix DNA binding protein
MELAKVSTNGQITVPVAVRRRLALAPGDKVLFSENRDGQIVLDNATPDALARAQAAFRGAASTFEVRDDADVQSLVDEVRYEARAPEE